MPVRGIAGRGARAGAGLSLGFLAVGAASAHAQDFTVVNTHDSGAGSLRQAVANANGMASDDRILFDSNLSGGIDLTSGQITITDAVQILGPGADEFWVDADDASRVFNVDVATPGDAVAIDGLSIYNGQTAGNGAGVRNVDSKFTLSSSVIRGGEVTGSGAGAGGGGFWDDGQYAGGSKTRILASTISDNYAPNGVGGGVGAADQIGEIVNSTIAENQSGLAGGGVSISGGEIADSTITGNTAGYSGEGPGNGMAVNGMTGPRVSLVNSIVGGNFGYEDPYSYDPLGADISGAETVDAAFSLVGSTEGGLELNETVAGSNIVGEDPLMSDRVSHNGGPTPTVRPLPGSPVFDQGWTGTGPVKDQRGSDRPVDQLGLDNSEAAGADGADMGAVELTAAENKAADLSVTFEASADPAYVGDPLTFSADVFNHGPDAAQDVIAETYLPPTLPATITGSSSACHFSPAYYPGSSYVSCDLGTVPATGQRHLEIVVTPTAAALDPDVNSGIFGYIEASTFDPNTYNNFDGVTPYFEEHQGVIVPPPPPSAGRGPDLAGAIRKCKKKFRGKKRAKCVKKAKKTTGGNHG